MSTPNNEMDGREKAALEILLRGVETMRDVIRQGRVAVPAHQQGVPRWEHLEARLHEIERLGREGSVRNSSKINALQQDFLLEFQADMADSMREVSERMIRFVDKIGQRVEEKKFEVDSKTRNELEDLMQPWHDGMREKMVGELPIETRRKLDEDRRQREGD